MTHNRNPQISISASSSHSPITANLFSLVSGIYGLRGIFTSMRESTAALDRHSVSPSQWLKFPPWPLGLYTWLAILARLVQEWLLDPILNSRCVLQRSWAKDRTFPTLLMPRNTTIPSSSVCWLRTSSWISSSSLATRSDSQKWVTFLPLLEDSLLCMRNLEIGSSGNLFLRYNNPNIDFPGQFRSNWWWKVALCYIRRVVCLWIQRSGLQRCLRSMLLFE